MIAYSRLLAALRTLSQMLSESTKDLSFPPSATNVLLYWYIVTELTNSVKRNISSRGIVF